MANNYLRFGNEFCNLSTDEAIWLEEKCDLLIEKGNILQYEILFNKNDKKRKIIFYSEEFSEVEEIAKLMQGFLQEFRNNKNDTFTITWSEYCDKLRIGEFGGGFVFICKDYYVIKNVYELAKEELERYENNK